MSGAVETHESSRARLPRSLLGADRIIGRDRDGRLVPLPEDLGVGRPEPEDREHLSHASTPDRPYLARAWVRAVNEPGHVHTARAWTRVDGRWAYRRHDYLNLLDDPTFGCVLVGITTLEDPPHPPVDERDGQRAATPWAILRISQRGEIEHAEGMVDELYGRRPGALVGMNGLEIIHPDDHALLLEAWTDIVERGSPGRAVRQRVHRPDGTDTWVLTSIGPPDHQGTVTVHDVDISDQLAAEEALRASEGRFRTLAATDDLTGLANRPALTLELDRRIAAETPTTVAFIDLDGFKTVNDERGHDEGDQVLRRVGSALRGLIRDADIAGRWGGDEFLLVLDRLPPDAQEDLRRRVHAAMTTCGAGGASVGFTSLGDDDDARVVVDRADRAMYADKQRR